VRVVVGNLGPGEFRGLQIFVVVRLQTTLSEMIIGDVSHLAVGGTVTLDTVDFRVTRESEVEAIADPFSNLDDRDRSNNAMRVVLAPPQPAPPTPTPTRSRE
jgi:hypothetical protein